VEERGLTKGNPVRQTKVWTQRQAALQNAPNRIRQVARLDREHDDPPIGCAALEKADPDHCYLERLAVTPLYRNNGFGKALVDHVLAQARAFEMKSIGIGIISEQADLKSWYRKIGFVEKETKQFPHLPFLVAFMTYTL